MRFSTVLDPDTAQPIEPRKRQRHSARGGVDMRELTLGDPRARLRGDITFGGYLGEVVRRPVFLSLVGRRHEPRSRGQLIAKRTVLNDNHSRCSCDVRRSRRPLPPPVGLSVIAIYFDA